MAGAGTQNVGSQTSAQSVSLANCGRDVGQSRPPYDARAVPVTGQVFFPNHPATNAYAPDLTSSFNQQRNQCLSYNTHGLYNANVGVNYQQGLPPSTQLRTESYSHVPVFAEPFEYTHVSPATLNSSFSSSAGSLLNSERMASMTLEPGPPPERTMSMGFRSNQHGTSTSIQGQNWAGNCPPTISPKMLRINPSPSLTPMSSSESIQTGIPVTVDDPDLGTPMWEQHEVRSALSAKHSSHRSRKELPTKPNKPRPSRLVPRESVTPRDKNKVYTRQDGRGSPLGCLTESISEAHPMVEAEDLAETDIAGSADAERDTKNRFLVESKLAGMTYREIRRQGGFTEAESTLRGRFRTLTKNKEQRVRKPEWQEMDVSVPYASQFDESCTSPYLPQASR